MVSSSAFAANPGHTITVTPHVGHVSVRFNGTVVAETDKALSLKEASYPPVFYIPFNDCSPGHFQKTSHQTKCPFKGTASYWTLSVDGKTAENAVWGYETPFDQVAEITGHVAFYPDKVEIEA
jgi:uncharacterized protein (DUF427 family)